METQKQILENSLNDLHESVQRLIGILYENANSFENKEEILNRLPLMDFYNDDLLASIKSLQELKNL